MDVPLKQIALGDVEQELASTRRLLERVPDEHMGWKPHERSWTLGELTGHIANLPLWFSMTTEGDEVDLDAGPPPVEPPADRDELLRRWDETSAGARHALLRMPDAALGDDWTLRAGETVYFTIPRGAALRSFVVSHLCHHRGQLTVYLRLLDVPLPPLYGPTADESPEW